MDLTKNFVIVLEPHDLKKTPLNYVQSRTFKDISENVEKQMADEGYWYRFVFVRRKEDLAGIALNINNSSFDFYWRETPRKKFEFRKCLDLAIPFNRIKTFSDHFVEFSRSHMSDLTLSDKPEEFEERYGRKRLPGEPEEGFRVPLFKPDKTDDGTVVLDGFIFPNKKEEFKQVFDNDFWTFYKKHAHYICQLTRDEFFERVRHGFNTIEDFATIEQFFEKKLPPAVIEKIAEIPKKYKIVQCSDTRTGNPRLIAGERGFFISGSHEENRFFTVATSKKDYDSFVGKLILGRSLISKENEEMER